MSHWRDYIRADFCYTDDIPASIRKNSMLTQFIGGRPGAVIIKLAILSILLGVFLSFFHIDPFDFWNSFKNLFVRIYNMGFDAIEWIGRYLLLGAIIVVPIWFVGRLWKYYANKSP